MQHTNRQYHLPESGKQLADTAKREGVEEPFPAPRGRKTLAGEVSLLAPYDHLRGEVELYLTRPAKTPDGQPCARLQSVPGRGQLLARVILSESQDLRRFPRGQDFVSSCRVVKCAKEAGGKRRGTAGTKIGTVHVRWAFAAAAVLFWRHNQPGKAYVAK